MKIEIGLVQIDIGGELRLADRDRFEAFFERAVILGAQGMGT